jgi:hypothetical protein
MLGIGFRVAWYEGVGLRLGSAACVCVRTPKCVRRRDGVRSALHVSSGFLLEGRAP